MTNPTKHEYPALPEPDEEDRKFLHYNPNTDDVIEFVKNYAKAYADPLLDANAALQAEIERLNALHQAL